MRMATYDIGPNGVEHQNTSACIIISAWHFSGRHWSDPAGLVCPLPIFFLCTFFAFKCWQLRKVKKGSFVIMFVFVLRGVVILFYFLFFIFNLFFDLQSTHPACRLKVNLILIIKKKKKSSAKLSCLLQLSSCSSSTGPQLFQTCECQIHSTY